MAKWRNSEFVMILIVLGIWGCRKDKTENPVFDERDYVTGNYTGISINNYWDYSGSPVVFRHDTAPATMRLDKSDQATLVKLFINNAYMGDFTYHDFFFNSTEIYHPPSLEYSHDSLFYHIQPSLSANTFDCKAKKIKN